MTDSPPASPAHTLSTITTTYNSTDSFLLSPSSPNSLHLCRLAYRSCNSILYLFPLRKHLPSLESRSVIPLLPPFPTCTLGIRLLAYLDQGKLLSSCSL